MAYLLTTPTTLTISNPSLEASKKHSMSMALIAAYRRAASAAAPLAVSVASRQKLRVNSVYVNNLSARTTAAASLVAMARSSSSHAKDLEPLGSDSDIIESINKEIKSTEEAHVNQVKAIRDEFHFEIYDDDASDFIILRRKFGNETIEIEAYLEDANDDEDVEIVETTTTGSSSTSEDEEEEGEIKNIEVKDEKEGEGKADEDLDTREKRELAFMVTVSKGEGRKLVFSCIGDEEDFMIKDVFFDIKKDNKEGEDDGADEGFTFNDLSSDLQRGFYKYLERRGVLPSTLGFLLDYMVNKERRGYLDWLNKMKQFIEN